MPAEEEDEGDERQDCSGEEGGSRAEACPCANALPEDAGDEAGGQRHEANGSVIDAVGGAAFFGRDKIGHEGAGCPIKDAVIDPIEGVEQHDLPDGIGQREAQIDDTIDGPADEDEATPPDAIRERTSGTGDEGIDEVEGHEEAEHTGKAEAAFLRAEDEEGIRRVAEGEDEDDDEEAAEGGGHLAEAEARGLGSGGDGGFARAEGEHDDGEDGGDEADEDDGLEGVAGEADGLRLGGEDDEEGDGKAGERAEGIPCPIDAKGEAATRGIDTIGDEGITGGGANAFADTISKADGEDGRPRGSEIEEGFGEGGEAVTENGQAFATAETIREPTGKDFEDAGGAVGDAFDEADDVGFDAEDVGEKEGKQVDDHLGGDVGQEAGEGGDPDVTGHGAKGGRDK